MLKRVGLWVLLSLVTIEVTLQIAGAVSPYLLSRAHDPDAEAEVTILCVGDSHTFGAPLPENQSYPWQLARALQRQYGDGVQVLNLGVPGANSAMVANRLEEQIARFRPDLVLVWAGVNSLWNPTETEIWDEDPSHRFRSALFKSKLVRLGAIGWYSLASAEHARPKLKEWSEERTVFQFGSETLVVSAHEPSGSWEEKRRGIELDFFRMVEIAERYEVPIGFFTYPYDDQPSIRTVNDAIRSVAHIRGVDVIETSNSLERARVHGFAIEQLVVNAAGPHPREVLYRYIVENLLPVVRRLVWPPPGKTCSDESSPPTTAKPMQ